jgi:DNA-binding IclR family transcriptional regulator
LVAGFEDPAARRSLANKIFRISRAMIGNELADQLRYPKTSTFGVLALLQAQNRADHLLQRMFPRLRSWRLAGRFQQMLDVTHYAEEGLHYRMPGHVHAEKDSHL